MRILLPAMAMPARSSRLKKTGRSSRCDNRAMRWIGVGKMPTGAWGRRARRAARRSSIAVALLCRGKRRDRVDLDAPLLPHQPRRDDGGPRWPRPREVLAIHRVERRVVFPMRVEDRRADDSIHGCARRLEDDLQVAHDSVGLRRDILANGLPLRVDRRHPRHEHETPFDDRLNERGLRPVGVRGVDHAPHGLASSTSRPPRMSGRPSTMTSGSHITMSRWTGASSRPPKWVLLPMAMWHGP